eukprot:scaffold2478_cov136-Skeletonema_menzelii.AAC.4
MQFLTLSDDGQMLPVHQCLKIPAGSDFEKCAREYTIFHYNNMSPVFETHTEFWKGRRFEVLMVPLKTNKQAVWVKAKVHKWEEYNNGPGDRFMKWSLNAKFTPDDSTIGVGSLVWIAHSRNADGLGRRSQRAKEEKKRVAVVTKVEEVETDNGEKIMMCNLLKCNSSDSVSERCAMDKLRPFDGIMSFHVFKMNVQGGGILSYDRLEQESFTMKWLDPEIGTFVGDRPPGLKYWYFEPTQIMYDLPELAKDDRVQQFRRDYLKKIESNATEMMGNKRGLQTIILKESLQRLKEGFMPDGFDTEPFQKLLLCIPYMLYADIVIFYFDWHGNDEARHSKFGCSKADEDGMDDELEQEDWYLIFDALIKVGMHLRHDEEWLNALKKSFTFAMPEEHLHNVLFNTNNLVGEWFEKAKEFRAAIWCYSQNLTISDDDYLAALKCNIALAYKKMDNFVDAHKYYEEAILVVNPNKVSKQELGDLFNNATALQQEAGHWFGTSDHLPPFATENVSSDANNKCQSCQAEGATKSCSACHLVCYCNIDCQKEHWKKVHKRTCLGKLRNK